MSKQFVYHKNYLRTDVQAAKEEESSVRSSQILALLALGDKGAFMGEE